MCVAQPVVHPCKHESAIWRSCMHSRHQGGQYSAPCESKERTSILKAVKVDQKCPVPNCGLLEGAWVCCKCGHWPNTRGWCVGDTFEGVMNPSPIARAEDEAWYYHGYEYDVDGSSQAASVGTSTYSYWQPNGYGIDTFGRVGGVVSCDHGYCLNCTAKTAEVARARSRTTTPERLFRQQPPEQPPPPPSTPQADPMPSTPVMEATYWDYGPARSHDSRAPSSRSRNTGSHRSEHAGASAGDTEAYQRRKRTGSPNRKSSQGHGRHAKERSGRERSNKDRSNKDKSHKDRSGKERSG